MLEVNELVSSLVKYIKYQIVLYCVWNNKIQPEIMQSKCINIVWLYIS